MAEIANPAHKIASTIAKLKRRFMKASKQAASRHDESAEFRPHALLKYTEADRLRPPPGMLLAAPPTYRKLRRRGLGGYSKTTLNRRVHPAQGRVAQCRICA